MDCAAVRAVQGTGTDMCGQGSKFALRAAGDFGVAVVISTDKPEDEFFVAGVDEKGDIKVSTAAYGIVKIIETQDSSLFAGFFIIMKFNHVTGGIGMADKGFAFTGFCGAGHGFHLSTDDGDAVVITVAAGHDKSQPSGCLLENIVDSMRIRNNIKHFIDSFF
uniref:hypothetical protein n=1 Tax=Salmonella enterica TaxID=28901 RepID=UPI00383BA85C